MARTTAHRYYHLIAFLKETEYLAFKYQKSLQMPDMKAKRITFLDTNQQLAFIKPSNYEISKKRKYKNDIGRIENMDYDEKVTLIFVETENSCYLHRSVVQNLKLDMSVKKHLSMQRM